VSSEEAWLTDPMAVIVDAVATVEPALDPVLVESLIGTVIPHRPRQRDLARALTEDPDLLVSGRPVAPRTLEKLTRALRQHGATVVVEPRCGRCGKPNPLPSWHNQVRVCAACSAVLRAESRREPCSGCGRIRVVRQRDRDSRPRCQACPVEIDRDPVTALVAIVRGFEPALSPQTIGEAVTAAAATAYEQQRLVWALQDQPGLLTDGGQGSRRLRALIDELQARGARTIAAPRCPFCAARHH
jgi:hypothetical protein